jgi:hypothetical protein
MAAAGGCSPDSSWPPISHCWRQRARRSGREQLHPRAVPLYNALHSYWGPRYSPQPVSAPLPVGAMVGALRGHSTSRSTARSATGCAPAMASNAPDGAGEAPPHPARPRDRRCAPDPRGRGVGCAPCAASPERWDPRTIPVQALSGQGVAHEAAIISAAFEGEAEAIEASRRGRDDPLAARRAYRRLALAHPRVYRLMTDQGCGATARARRRAASGPSVYRAAGGDADRAARRAFAHGMALLGWPTCFPRRRYRRGLARGPARVSAVTDRWDAIVVRLKGPMAWRRRRAQQGRSVLVLGPRRRSAAACAAQS